MEPSDLSGWTQAPDGELVRRHLAGEAGASRELFRRYAARIHGVGRSLLGVDDAEDIVQEVFLIAFRSMQNIREADKVGNWLYRVAQNCCREQLRRRGREKAAVTASLENTLAEQSSPVDSERIARAVASMPEKLRLALDLKYRQGLSHSELAELLGISQSGVNTRLYRARMMLRQRLEKAGHHGS